MLCHLILQKRKGNKNVVNDETLRIINKPKHQKRVGGGHEEQNGRTHIQEAKRIT